MNVPRVVLVSGASRGIGEAVVRELLAHGYRVGAGARDATALAAKFGPDSPHFFAHAYEALDKASAQDWVDAVAARWGRIDVLVNNAGVASQMTLEQDDEDELDRLWAINVKAPLRMTRLCLPYLRESGQGRIVNFSSLSGKRVRNQNIAYSLTKFAMMALSHTTRQASWQDGVRTTAICPGFVKTDLTSYVTSMAHEDMSSVESIATLVRTVVELPNNAAVAELLVNCRLEDTL